MNKNVAAIGVAVVVGISALLFATMRVSHGDGAVNPTVTTTVATPVAPPLAPSVTTASLQSVPRISPAAVQEKITTGQLVVMDVRDIDSYTASHIAGAMHIPLSYVASELPYLPRGKPIVAYCT